MEIKAVSEQVHEDINKTQELEARKMTLETAVVESNKTTKEYSSEINTLKKNQCGEVERLKTELKRGATQMMVYPTQIDERTKLLVFRGSKGDNQNECLLNCEQEMELTGNALTCKEKINFISKLFQGSAARWYTIAQYNVCLLYTSRCV